MMALRVKRVNWQSSTLPPDVRGNLHMVIQAVIAAYNWNFIRYEGSNYKLIIRNLGCQMCIYLSTMTIQTALDHPHQGKTQLTRKRVSALEFAELLKNPRAHTKKGYYTKKRR